MKKTAIIVYRFPLETHLVKSVEVEYDSDTNLAMLCKENQEGCRYLTFSQYYSLDERDLMTFGRVFPYIRKEERIEWNVPYEEVTVEDFFRTHEPDNYEIHVEINGVAGWSPDMFSMSVHSWLVLKTVLEAAGYVITAIELIQIIIKIFGRKKERIPGVHSFRTFILSRDFWDAKELSDLLHTDEILIFMILETFGYEEHGGVYWKNAWKVHQFEKAFLGKKLIFNETDKYCYDYLQDKLADINLNLLYICALDEDKEKEVYRGAVNSLRRFMKDNPNICYDELNERFGITTDNLIEEEKAVLDLLLQQGEKMTLKIVEEME